MVWQIDGKVTGVPSGTEFVELGRLFFSTYEINIRQELTADGSGDYPFSFTTESHWFVSGTDNLWLMFSCYAGAAQDYETLGAYVVGPYTVSDVGVEV